MVWGRRWDALLHADSGGALVNLMNRTPDGDFQTYKANDGAYVREHFFGRDPRTQALVDHMSDSEIWNLKRGGHDYRKVYAAYRAATEHQGQPTVILAKTIKGYTLGTHFQGRNATHQMKKFTLQDLKDFRDFMRIPVSDAQLEENPTFRRTTTRDRNPRIRYLLDRRTALGGFLPQRRTKSRRWTCPARGLQGAQGRLGPPGGGHHDGDRAGVQELLRETGENGVGRRIVPIIPDEARTFGMDSWFPPPSRSTTATASSTPRSTPSSCWPTKESPKGQILHEGINEGRLHRRVHRGRHRVLDPQPADDPGLHLLFDVRLPAHRRQLLGGHADQMARGFVLGATAGRTTLTGEGPSARRRALAAAGLDQPAVVAYDPAFAYGSPTSSKAAWPGCSARTRRTSTSTSPSTTRPTPSRPGPTTSTWRPCCAGCTATGRPARSAAAQPRSWPPGWRCPTRCAPRPCWPSAGTSLPTSGR